MASPERLCQFLLIEGSFWPHSPKACVPCQFPSSCTIGFRFEPVWKGRCLAVGFPLSFYLFFLLPIQMALLIYGLVASPSSCGDCSPGWLGWLGFFYIQPVRVALGNTLGQTVKEILMIFFFLLGCREVKLWRKAGLGFISCSSEAGGLKPLNSGLRTSPTTCVLFVEEKSGETRV